MPAPDGTLTTLERELVAELDTIAGLARATELSIQQKRATTGTTGLVKIQQRAGDAARHARARDRRHRGDAVAA